MKLTTFHENVFKGMLMSSSRAAIVLFVYIFFSNATYMISCVKADGRVPGRWWFINTRSSKSI